MCGICGFVGSHPALDRESLGRMNESIRRRGPDDEGYFVAAGVGLAMRRLSILDLEGGRQPVFNEDGTVCVVFNGEIYNFRALRDELETRGHRFRTHSDTEVLVHLYEEDGVELVHRLRGMFAFALWDGKARRGLIARDRLGIKPLFYATVDKALIFGSEIKSLLASGAVPRRLNEQAVDEFLAFTYVPAPDTIFRDIRKLEPGHRLVIEDGRTRNERYWDVSFTPQDHALDERQWVERVGDALRSAVACHLVSDVPVGAFLSGGIDSSLVTAYMSESVAEPVETFTMGFGGVSPLVDERQYARQMAKRYGFSYNEFTVMPELPVIIDDVVRAFDEPFADDSVIPSYYISELTARKVKVALSGLGGDELFAGYHRYSGFYLSRIYACLPSFMHRYAIQPLVQALPDTGFGDQRIDHLKRFTAAAKLPPAERYLLYVSSAPEFQRRKLYVDEVATRIDFSRTAAVVTEPFRSAPAENDIDRMFYTDIKTYLPDDILALSDRLSMWHSLELRVPLVDHELVELCARMPFRLKLRLNSKKYLLRKIAADKLPPAILGHRKQGFEAPMAAWLRHDLAGFARDRLAPMRIEQMGLFEPRVVSALLEDHLTGRHRHNKLLFSLIMFGEWFDHYMH